MENTARREDLDDAVEIRDGLLFGRSSDADILLPDESVSRRHFSISGRKGEWVVEDLGSKTGTFLNGHLIQRTGLVYGDFLSAGPFAYRFDGCRLSRVAEGGGARLTAFEVSKAVGETIILDEISLTVEPGQFVGVIGPSGAGKSSLLDALCGLRPANEGLVLLDGVDLLRHPSQLRDVFGYVPQDDIVPMELAVADALDYAARLRLPANVPAAERRRLVLHVIDQLGLSDRAQTRVGRLSGGQRKRVSVAAELLVRPRLLFLDEPTSGLDPAAEFSLMEVLRGLAVNGCTVVCTTHIMENAYLMDRLAILKRGQLVFYGDPESATSTFGVSRLTQIYERLGEDADVASEEAAESDSKPVPISPGPGLIRTGRRAAAFPVLLLRDWAVMRSDAKNLALLIGQPVFIALLVSWVSDDVALKLFFAVIATLWFGCGNAAQEIVKELPMFRRERLVGLGRGVYLSAKFVSLARISVGQSLLLYGVLALCAGGLDGSVAWQIAALIATALASVGIGLAISAWSRSVLQAVMLVPIILIPQILFSGFVPPAGDFGTAQYAVSRAMPSAAAQSIMDVALFWDRKIEGALRVDFPSAFSNLNRESTLKNGQIFRNPTGAIVGIAVLFTWCLATLAATWLALRKRETG